MGTYGNIPLIMTCKCYPCSLWQSMKHPNGWGVAHVWRYSIVAVFRSLVTLGESCSVGDIPVL